MNARYKPGEFAKKINRSLGTLRIWHKNGKLSAKRLLSGHRYYTKEIGTLVIAFKDRLCRFMD